MESSGEISVILFVKENVFNAVSLVDMIALSRTRCDVVTDLSSHSSVAVIIYTLKSHNAFEV